MLFLSQEAWQFLLKSASKDFKFLGNAWFSLPSTTPDEETESESFVSSSSWDNNALLFQYIPSVVFVLHLIHEVCAQRM